MNLFKKILFLTVFLICANSLIANNPIIKLYTGMDSRLGGYIELIVGLDEEGKAFGHLIMGKTKDTIIAGEENKTSLHLKLQSGKKLIVSGFRTDKMNTQYIEQGKKTTFKLLKLKREATINGLYCFKNDSTDVVLYVFQTRAEDYICLSIKTPKYNCRYSGTNNNQVYGEYLLNCNGNKISVKENTKNIKLTIKEETILLMKK